MTIDILPVQSEADKRAFYKFAFKVYKDDPNWVPPLWSQRKGYLDKKAAFFSYGEGDFWMAKEKGKILGTLGTAINHSRNGNLGSKAGLFGFFEVLPGRYDAARAMWDHARTWSRDRGMDELHGPYSFSGEDEHGFLVQGFETTPSIMLAHTARHLCEYAEQYGFEKVGETVAYRFDFESIGFDIQRVPPAMLRVAERARRRYGERVLHNPKMADWDEEVDPLCAVYNKSLAVLPGFYPVELAEFRAQARGLKDIIDPDLVFIAKLDGKTIGFALGLPNIAEALMHANGLQYPWDYVRFLRARRRIQSASFKIMAMDPDYWGYGIDALMYVEIAKAFLRKKYTWVDASLTGEDNPQTNKLLTRCGATIYRRYREYRLKL